MMNNYLDMDYVTISSNVCFEDGCILNAFSFNYLNIQNMEIYYIIYFSDFSIFYIEQLNTLSISTSTFQMQFEELMFEAILFKVDSLNSINILNVTYNIRTFSTIYLSKTNNSFVISNERISSFANFQYYFNAPVIGSPTELQIFNTNFKFSVAASLILCSNCNFIMKNVALIMKSFGINVFQFNRSTISFIKCSFLNPNKVYSNLINSLETVFFFKYCVFFNLFEKNSPQITIQHSILNTDFLEQASVFSKNIILKTASQSSGSFMSFETLDYVNQNFTFSKITNIQLQRNRFLQNNAFMGGSLYLSSLDVFMEIDKNSFMRGKAALGGDIYIDKCWINISNNTFSYSKVNPIPGIYDGLTKGGAIYIANDSKITLFLYNNTFLGNQADNGQSIYIKYALNINFQNNLFLMENSSKSHSSVLMALVSLKFLSIDGHLSDCLSPVTVVSGLKYEYCLFMIIPLDSKGNYAINGDQNIINDLNLTQLMISNSSENSNSISFGMQSGYVCFDGPFTRNQLPIQESFSYHVTFHNSSLFFTLEFRNCIVGEYLSENFECIPCENGTFSFETEFDLPFLCSVCEDSIPFECLGGDGLTPKPDYWRINRYSNNFLRCLIPKVCLQILDSSVEEFYTGKCAKGYRGPLCNLCDTNYGKFTDGLCLTCEFPGIFLFLFKIIGFILKTIYYVYVVYIGFKMLYSITLMTGTKKKVIGISLLKILIIHIQILSFIPKIPLNWVYNTKIVATVIFTFFTPDINDFMDFECLWDESKMIVNPVYLSLIICPFFIFMVLLLSTIVIRRLKYWKNLLKELNGLRIDQILATIFRIIVFISFVDICSVYLKMLQCIDIGDSASPTRRLYMNLEIDCDSKDHMDWVFRICVPMLCMSISFILFMFSRLVWYKMKNCHYNYDIKFRFGYYFFAYRKNFYYWDIVILLRRILVTFVFFYFYDKIIDNIFYPFLLIYFIILASFILQMYYSPFKYKFQILNHMESVSLFIMSANISFILFYFMFFSYVLENEFLNIILIMAIFSTNFFFFIVWFWAYYKYFLKSKRKNWLSLKLERSSSPMRMYLNKIKEHLTGRFFLIEPNFVHPKEIKKKNGDILRTNLFTEIFSEIETTKKHTPLIKRTNNSFFTRRIEMKDYSKIGASGLVFFLAEGGIALDRYKRSELP